MFYSTASLFFFFFNDTATTEIYTLSLHDALPIYRQWPSFSARARAHVTHMNRSVRPKSPLRARSFQPAPPHRDSDRKSTRLNSSHLVISYAVFCLKKKTTHVHRLQCHRFYPPPLT